MGPSGLLLLAGGRILRPGSLNRVFLGARAWLGGRVLVFRFAGAFTRRAGLIGRVTRDPLPDT